jgi:hypothetical protein
MDEKDLIIYVLWFGCFIEGIGLLLIIHFSKLEIENLRAIIKKNKWRDQNG